MWLFEGAEGGKWVEEIERRYQTSSATTPLSSSPAASASDDRQMKKARVQ